MRLKYFDIYDLVIVCKIPLLVRALGLKATRPNECATIVYLVYKMCIKSFLVQKYQFLELPRFVLFLAIEKQINEDFPHKLLPSNL